MKFELNVQLDKSKMSMPKKRDLYRFLDFLLQLPIELEKQYNEKIELYQKERKMTYVSQIERTAAKKAKTEGMHIKALNIAKKLLMKGLGIKEVSEMTELPLSEIRHLRMAH